MSKSYATIRKQIEKLQQEAEHLRQRELKDVVGRIKEAISHYGLTSADLFGTSSNAKPAGKAASRGGKTTKGKKAAPAKYRDESGNSWTGRGKRPNWFKAALAAGKTPEDLLIK